MITHKRVYVKRFCKFFCNLMKIDVGTGSVSARKVPRVVGDADPYDNKSRTAAIPASVRYTPPLALAVSAVT